MPIRPREPQDWLAQPIFHVILLTSPLRPFSTLNMWVEKNNYPQEPTSWVWCVASAHTLGLSYTASVGASQSYRRPCFKRTELNKQAFFLLPYTSIKTLLWDGQMDSKPALPLNESWKAALSYMCLASGCCFTLRRAGDSASFKSSKSGLVQLLKLSHFLRKHKNMPRYGISPKNFQ